VAEKADRAGKPIVALKVGSSPAGQQAALAHTGSVAGDDAVVDAVLRPAQCHPGHQPGGAADHRGGPRLRPLAARQAAWAC